MEQSKRTTAARVILGTPQSLYFWPSIGLRWPKRKGAAEHCAYVPIAARPQPAVWAGGRRISQIGHPCRSAALAPSPLCPRSLLRETDCVQTRGANRILMRRSKKHPYSITSSAKQGSWDRLFRDLGVDHALPRAIVIEFTIRYATQQQSVGLRDCARACNEPHSVRKSGARHAGDWLVAEDLELIRK